MSYNVIARLVTLYNYINGFFLIENRSIIWWSSLPIRFQWKTGKSFLGYGARNEIIVFFFKLSMKKLASAETTRIVRANAQANIKKRNTRDVLSIPRARVD